MAPSDDDFIDSDDDELPTARRKGKGKRRERAAWEASIQDRENPMMVDTDENLIERIAWEAERKKRERYTIPGSLSSLGKRFG
jgi:hypothetical protein